jgi:hypothetical protein
MIYIATGPKREFRGLADALGKTDTRSGGACALQEYVVEIHSNAEWGLRRRT